MIAISSSQARQHHSNGSSKQSDNGFLRFLPAVQTHACIQFRHLPEADREEAVAEAVAGAFLNYRSAERRGTTHRLRPSTVANYAVRGVKDGRRTGGSCDSKTDVLSFKARRLGGFEVYPLPRFEDCTFDCMKAPDQEVWRDRLVYDRRALPADLACFRIDWSSFMAGQADRTRTLLAMLAAGHKQCEIADHLGVTPAAVCQRRSKARREWAVFQGEGEGNGQQECSSAREPTDPASVCPTSGPDATAPQSALSRATA